MSDIDVIAEGVLAASPFPSVTPTGELRDGSFLKQPRVCRNCPDHRCRELYAEDVEFKPSACYRGMGIALLAIGTGKIVVTGLLLPGSEAKVPRRVKKEMAAYQISHEQLKDWRTVSSELIRSADERIRNTIDTSLGMLHDVQTSVSTILRNAEAFISQQPGSNQDERVESLPPAAKALIKSTELLDARLAMMPLLTNPQSARFGKRHATPIYRLVDRLVRILRSTASQRNIDLRITGSSRNTPLTFDSFETVPLVLLENAIKYSQPRQVVEVDVNDVGRGIEVRISSFSPVIPPAERAHLFERGFRGSKATVVASQGSGLGLHLGKIVADAHGFEIHHSCGDPVVQIDGIDYCPNIFSFVVPHGN